MKFIKRMIDSVDWIPGKVFAYSIQFLIVVSLVTLSIETLPGLNPQTKHYLDSSEYFWKAFREGKLKALKVGEGKQAVYRISRHDLNEWYKLKGGFRY